MNDDWRDLRFVGVSDFEAVIAGPASVVAFVAAWNPGCCRFATRLREFVATAGPGLPLVCVDVDDWPDLTAAWVIASVPTILVFEGGRVSNRTTAAQAGDCLTELQGRGARSQGVD